MATDDLEFALQLADLADEITMSRYRADDLRIDTKPDATPVTEADRAAERALRQHIADERPTDMVIGEEYGGERASAGERVWILDPIDGTKSYVRGMPTWSTLIALQIGGEPQVGVISMPALGRRWWAATGRGAFADGCPIVVSQVDRLDDAQLGWGGIEDWDAVGRLDGLIALARACARSRGLGDALQYALVAEGAAEIAIDPEASLWDLAAVQVIVEQAGGRFTDLAGARTAGGGDGIASNGLVHDAALRFVGR